MGDRAAVRPGWQERVAEGDRDAEPWASLHRSRARRCHHRRGREVRGDGAGVAMASATAVRAAVPEARPLPPIRTGPAWGAWLVQLVVTTGAFSASNLLATRLDACGEAPARSSWICAGGHYDHVVNGFWRMELVLLVAVPLLLLLVPNRAWRQVHVRPVVLPAVAVLVIGVRLWQLAHALP